MKKKIAVIGPGLKMGGMERASCNFANSFHDLGYEVIYISMFKHPVFFSLKDGIKFVEPDGFNVNSLNFIKTVGWIRKQVLQANPDTVFVLNKFYSAIALLSLAFSKFPVFISERSSPHFPWNKKIDLFSKTIFRLFPPKGVVAQTGIAATYQKQYHNNAVKFEVIPNPLRDVKRFDVEKENYVLAIGRLNDWAKGFDRLMEAFALVQATDWKLVFAGGDEDAGKLKHQAAQLGILDKVLFLGKVDVDAILSKSKIFVIPSRSEGFPNALCEAMAAGLPCIAFDFVAGPKDIITHNVDGIIVKDGDIEALGAAITDLIANPEKRNTLGTNALNIRERLNSNSIGKQMLDFILK